MHALILAISGGAIAILAASFLPIWTLWYSTPMDAYVYNTTLWHVLQATVIDPPADDPHPIFQVTVSGDLDDAFLGATIFGAGIILGFSGSLLQWRVARW